MLRDAAVLALNAFTGLGTPFPGWSAQDAALLRRLAARHLTQRADAAAILGRDAARLADGIDVVSIMHATGGPFGPNWTGHPFISPAMDVRYQLREPDVTRELAHVMGPAAGRRGQERCLSFLRLLTGLARLDDLQATLHDGVSITVAAEHTVPIVARRERFGQGRADHGVAPSQRAAPARIDLLFQWPTSTGSRAVLAVEAKFGAVVSKSQLHHYRRAALQLARGGPVGLVLLTAERDEAERRYTSWRGVRWFALMRRWEAALAAAGDHDDEFTRVRAHIWRHLLHRKGFRQ